jgi:hypothetical protein
MGQVYPPIAPVALHGPRWSPLHFYAFFSGDLSKPYGKGVV